jgi:hypothetical protein
MCVAGSKQSRNSAHRWAALWLPAPQISHRGKRHWPPPLTGNIGRARWESNQSLLQLRQLFPRRVPERQVVCPFGPRVGGPTLTVCPATAHAQSRPRWLPFPQPAPPASASTANIVRSSVVFITRATYTGPLRLLAPTCLIARSVATPRSTERAATLMTSRRGFAPAPDYSRCRVSQPFRFNDASQFLPNANIRCPLSLIARAHLNIACQTASVSR